MTQLGFGVMLKRLGGNAETVTSIQACLSHKINRAELSDNVLRLYFPFGVLKIWDDGQSCCEERYMRTDDDLSVLSGATFLDIELKDTPEVEEDYMTHEVQFLEITTDNGVVTFSNHNEHNGYYGGFAIEARLIEEVLL